MDIVAHHWASKNAVNNPDMILARTYGELVATGFARDKNTVHDIEESRRQIYKILLQNKPAQNTFQNTISEIIKRCTESPRNQVVTPEVAAKYMDIQVEVSLQTYTFYSLRGQSFSASFLKHQDARAAWVNLADPAVGYVELVGLNFEIEDDITNRWLQMTEDSMLGYIEARAILGVDRCRCIIAASIFVYLVSMTKEHNLTASWIGRRRRQFQDRLPGLSLEAYITDGAVRQFPRYYTLKDPTWQGIYDQLALCWSMLQCEEGLSLAWIIEQSTSSNVTCLITIADVVSRLQYFDVELLIRKGVPESNFVNASRMALDLLRNPFCSIVRPTINLRQYADLAYVCTHIKRELMKDTVFGGYRGAAGSMCVIAELELRILANGIFNISRAKAEAELSLIDQYKLSFY